MKENFTQVSKENLRPVDVKERVKTFEDACNELGSEHPCVVAYNELQKAISKMANTEGTKDVTAFLKMRIITAALNEGWKPTFEEDEWVYYPCY
ncbi:hypothetical protein EVA_20133, partial [gut metagenome]